MGSFGREGGRGRGKVVGKGEVDSGTGSCIVGLWGQKLLAGQLTGAVQALQPRSRRVW